MSIQDPIIGTQFGSCVVEAKVAVGGFATIYRATDSNLGIDRAVKIFHSHLAGAEEFSERLNTEMQVLATLDHPNIVKIAFSLTEGGDGVSGFVMEFVEGETLSQVLERRGRLPLDDALLVMEQILDAMAYAHSHEVIHRDLTPDNVILKPDGSVKLMDFGISKTLHRPNVTQTGIVLGKPLYMAPEQFEGEVTMFADQYALGVILYELITGMVPFEGDSPIALYKMHLEEEVRLPREFEGQLPNYVERSIFKALAKEPEHRFESIQAFLDVLRDKEWPEADALELQERYEKALWLYRRSDIAGAGDALQALLAKDPTHEDARRLLDSCASAREQLQQTELATKAYQAVRASVHKRLGRDHLMRYLSAFMDAASQVPESRVVRKQYRDVRRRHGRLLEDVRRGTQSRNRLRKDKVDDLMEKGRHSLAIEDFEAAAALFDKVLGMENHTEARSLRAEAKETMRMRQGTALLTGARNALKSEDYATAIAKCEKLLRSTPGNEEAQRVLELARDALSSKQVAERKRLAQAKEAQRRLEEGLKHLEAWEHDKAIARFRAVLDLEPDHPQATDLLSEAISRLDDEGQMASISTLFDEGLTQFNVGKYSEAASRFTAVLEMFPEHMGARTYLARAEEAANRRATVQAHIARGVEQFGLGDYPNALLDFEAALAIEGGNREAQRYVALCHELSGGELVIAIDDDETSDEIDGIPQVDTSELPVQVELEPADTAELATADNDDTAGPADEMLDSDELITAYSDEAAAKPATAEAIDDAPLAEPEPIDQPPVEPSDQAGPARPPLDEPADEPRGALPPPVDAASAPTEAPSDEALAEPEPLDLPPTDATAGASPIGQADAGAGDPGLAPEPSRGSTADGSTEAHPPGRGGADANDEAPAEPEPLADPAGEASAEAPAPDQPDTGVDADVLAEPEPIADSGADEAPGDEALAEPEPLDAPQQRASGSADGATLTPGGGVRRPGPPPPPPPPGAAPGDGDGR